MLLVDTCSPYVCFGLVGDSEFWWIQSFGRLLDLNQAVEIKFLSLVSEAAFRIEQNVAAEGNFE